MATRFKGNFHPTVHCGAPFACAPTRDKHKFAILDMLVHVHPLYELPTLAALDLLVGARLRGWVPRLLRAGFTRVVARRKHQLGSIRRLLQHPGDFVILRILHVGRSADWATLPFQLSGTLPAYAVHTRPGKVSTVVIVKQVVVKVLADRARRHRGFHRVELEWSVKPAANYRAKHKNKKVHSSGRPRHSV